MKDLTGKKFGRWSVISYAGHSRWNCKCDCGTTKEVVGSYLVHGRSKSCKCYQIDRMRKDHKAREHPLYTRWMCMWRRTTDKKHKNYKYYGARGITVDPKWKKFRKFIEDMGEIPYKNATIERIDNNKGYSKKNCRWATMTEQNNNKRNVPLISFNGKSQSVGAWAKDYKISYNSLYRRIYYKKLPIADALAINRNNKRWLSKEVKIDFNGITKNISDWARTFNLNPSTLYGRLFTNKWPIEIAFTKPARKIACPETKPRRHAL